MSRRHDAALTIDRDTLRAWLDRGEPLTVLDVRPRAERDEWAIPGSLHVDAHDALWSGDALDDVALPPGRRIVTVCSAGRTSVLAALALRRRGLDARSLEGGMAAWSLAWNTADVPISGSLAAILQVRRTGKGCLSYIVAAGRDAAVIDPAVEPDVFERLARRRGWTIRAVLDTHIHADHLSRGRALAERCGATLYLPEQPRAHFDHHPLADGDEVRVGPARLEVLRLPGHTMESSAYLLDGRAFFTGDTLFLAAVGRPDLEATEQEMRERARALYRSLKRLGRLSPEVVVLPGHTDAPVPFDGRPLADPLGSVLARIDLLGDREDAFVEALVRRIPPTPPNHRLIVKLNEAGALPGGDPGVFEAGANRCAIR